MALTTNAQGQLICPTQWLGLRTTTGAPSYPLGAQPILGLTVTNNGPEACVRDLSGPLQVFTAFGANGARVWSTSDCFPGTGHDVRVLGSKESVSYTVKWSGTTSTPGCATPRLRVLAGRYTIVASLDGVKATPAALTFTG